jgi:hypothetical protein
MNNVTGGVFNEWYTILLNSINELAVLVGGFLPKLLGALVLLFVGVLVAKSIRSIAEKILKLTKLEATLSKGAFDEVIKTAGVKVNVVSFILNLVYWTVVLVFVMSVADVLGLPIVSRTISQLIGYIPNILAGLIVAIITFSFSRIVKDLIVVSLERLEVTYRNTLGNVVQILINVFGLLIAVNQLGLDLSLIYTNITLIIGAILITLVIVFSLGSKSVVANMIAGYYVQKMVKVGDNINVGGVKGRIKELTSINMLVEANGETVLVPYTKILDTGSF